VPLSQPHHFPIHLLPSRVTEETPGAHASYEKLLSRVISERPAGAQEDEEAEVELIALEGVEPEIGLVNWTEEILGLVCSSTTRFPALLTIDSGTRKGMAASPGSKNCSTSSNLSGFDWRSSRTRSNSSFK
jgi:hypothetical protein